MCAAGRAAGTCGTLLLLGCFGSEMGFSAFVSRGVLLNRNNHCQSVVPRKEREIWEGFSLWKSKLREDLLCGFGIFFCFNIFFTVHSIIQWSHTGNFLQNYSCLNSCNYCSLFIQLILIVPISLHRASKCIYQEEASWVYGHSSQAEQTAGLGYLTLCFVCSLN